MDQRAALQTYGQEVLRWGRKINLTGAATLPEIASPHLLDSFALASLLPRTFSLLDVGSGAGFLAVALAILRPAARVEAWEPAVKKATFLSHAGRLLCLANLTVRRQRLARTTPILEHEWLASRATFGPDEWIGRAAAVARQGARIAVFALRGVEVEPREGLAIVARMTYGEEGRRQLIIISKKS